MPLISIGQLIDRSWEHYRRHFREFTALAIWLLLPCLISVITIVLYPSAATLLAQRQMSVWEKTAVFVWMFNNFLLAPIIGLWIFAATVRFLASFCEKNIINLKIVCREGWKKFLPVVLVNILISLLLLSAWLLSAPGLLLNWLGLAIESAWLVSVGNILLIAGLATAAILNFRWLITLWFSCYEAVVGSEGGKKALKKSHALVKGRFFPVLFRLLAVKIVFVALVLIAEFIILYLLNFLIDAAAGLNADLLFRLSSIAFLVVFCVGSIMLTPLLIVADFLLFNSLRESR